MLGGRRAADRAGVVHQHVDGRPAGERVHEGVDGAAVGEVAAMPGEAAAARLDLAPDVAAVRLEVRADADHVGARLGEGDRDRPPDAAPAAR